MAQFPSGSKVLYLSYDGLCDPLGQSQILPYLIGLSKKNYAISVISFEKTNNFKSLQPSIQKTCNAQGLIWYPLIYHKSPAVLSTLYDIWQLFRETKKLHRKTGFKIVHCRSYITALVGLHLKRKHSLKFVFDMRGFWADERVEGKLWNLNNPLYSLIYKFFKVQEKSFLQESDYIISLTESAKAVFDKWEVKSPVMVIPCCVDLDLFDPRSIRSQDKELLKKKIGIEEHDFVLLYLGSWGTWYLTDEMMAFFEKLRSRISNAKFLIVSPDTVDVDKELYADTVIVKKAKRQEVPIYISIANAAILFIKPSFSKKGSSATKVAELLAMNVPVITNPGWGDIETIMKNCGGHLISEDNINLTAQSFDSKDTRGYCREFLSLEMATEKYAYVYENLSR